MWPDIEMLYLWKANKKNNLFVKGFVIYMSDNASSSSLLYGLEYGGALSLASAMIAFPTS